MKFFPFSKLVLNSALNVNELNSRLNEYVEPPKFSWFDCLRKTSKLYIGKISGQNFAIRQIRKGQNSFAPYIIGKIETHGTGTKIVLTMRLHYAVILFMLWIIGFILYSEIKYHQGIGLWFILFMYIMTMFGFNLEYNKVKKDLQIMLDAHNEAD